MAKKRFEEELENMNKKKKRRSMACCEREEGVKRGAWSSEEDKILVDFITKNGHGTWRNLPKLAGLLRCGKSCRLRWTNYLRPDIKRGPFTPEEENTIIHLHSTLGNKWAAMATHLPGRTDNDIKNFWNSHLRKRFGSAALNQSSSSSSKPTDMNSETPLTRHMSQWENVRLEAESRLPTKPVLLKAPSKGKAKGDYFLRLWNSEVGESFRNVNANTSERDRGASESPNSETSSLTKAESDSKGANLTGPGKMTDSPAIADQKTETWETKKEVIDQMVTYSDMTTPGEFDDSSDAMLKLLLDFPVGGNDMGFLEGPSNDVSA